MELFSMRQLFVFEIEWGARGGAMEVQCDGMGSKGVR